MEPIERAVAGLRGVLRPHEADLLLTHLLSGRSAAHWDERACARLSGEIRNQRANARERVNRAFVAKKTEALRNGSGPAATAAAKRWMLAPLDAFLGAVRAHPAGKRVPSRAWREAFLASAFVVCVLEANAPRVRAAPVIARIPAPTLPGRPRL